MYSIFFLSLKLSDNKKQSELKRISKELIDKYSKCYNIEYEKNSIEPVKARMILNNKYNDGFSNVLR